MARARHRARAPRRVESPCSRCAEAASMPAAQGASGDSLVIRRATSDDLKAVVSLFALDDDGNREDAPLESTLDPRYVEAIEAIANDPNNALMVAVDASQRVVGV